MALIKLWAKEPAVVVGAVEAVIVLLVGFGVPLTGEQVALITGAIVAVGSLITRLNVFSPETVTKMYLDTEQYINEVRSNPPPLQE